MKYPITVAAPSFLRAEAPGQATPTSVQREDVQMLIESGAQVLDVLTPTRYAEAHLPGAINIPLAELNEATAARLRWAEPVIVYCYDDQ